MDIRAGLNLFGFLAGTFGAEVDIAFFSRWRGVLPQATSASADP